MDLLQTAEGFINSVNGFAFIMGCVISGVVYMECRKCLEQIERDEMLERFLEENH